jgi:His/Glu/Gln/Arg/opine family amino acid ABC transporter permease subunit
MDYLINLISFSPNTAQAVTQFFSRLPSALWVSCLITGGATVIALVVGMVLALLRVSGVRWASWTAAALVYVGRCIPLPSFQFLMYFLLLATFRADGIVTAIVVLGILNAPIMAELFRSGLASVPTIQIEAARALGMSASTVRNRVVMPLAVRVMLPAIGQMVVGILLTSAFASQIGVRDITGVGRNIINTLFATELWLVVAFVYFAIAFPMSRALSWLERRLATTTGVRSNA